MRQDRPGADRAGNDALSQSVYLQPAKEKGTGRTAAAISTGRADFDDGGVMPPLTSITILYDAACGLCTRAKDWIRQQEPLVGVRFVAMGSEEARRRFGRLPAGELAVVANTGEVWLGNPRSEERRVGKEGRS